MLTDMINRDGPLLLKKKKKKTSGEIKAAEQVLKCQFLCQIHSGTR